MVVLPPIWKVGIFLAAGALKEGISTDFLTGTAYILLGLSSTNFFTGLAVCGFGGLFFMEYDLNNS